MPFGNKAEPSKRYCYGAKAPQEQDLFFEQIKLGNNYVNKLVENELNRRKQYQETRNSYYPEIAVLQNQIEEKYKLIVEKRKSVSQQNQLNGKKGDTVVAKEIKLIEKEIKILKDNKKTLIDTAKGNSQLELDVIKLNAAADTNSKKIRKQYRDIGLGWGTAGKIDQASVKKSGNNPKFHRFTGEGCVAVQIQKTKLLSLEKLFAGTDGRAQLIKTERKNCYILKLRIAGDKKRWKYIHVPFKMHRELPADKRITWIEVQNRKVATHNKWEVQFILAAPEWPSTHNLSNTGFCGIDVGWRKTEEGLRIACYSGSDGKDGYITIPNNQLNRYRKIEDLQSIRSLNYNKIHELLKQYVKNNVSILPEWLLERTKTIVNWTDKSQNRLASLVNFWRNNRFEDDTIFEQLEEWRQQDKHLYDWQENQRKKFQAWRNDFYRKECLKLRRQYKKIAVEDVDWSILQKNKGPEEVETVSKYNQRIASVGKFRETLKEYGNILEINAKNTSKTCHKCGKLCVLTGEQIHTCEHCNMQWDRDFNASRNILAKLVANATV